MTTYGHVTRDRDGRWVIDAQPHVALRLKRVIGKVGRGAQGPIRLSNTPENCRDLAWFCERYPLEIAPLLKAALEHGAQQHAETILRLEQIAHVDHAPQAFDLALPLRSYQAREAEIYLTRGALLIADDVGLGKTASAIGSFTESQALPAVVVTLTHLPDQWADEIRKFAPELLVHVVRRGTPYPFPTFMGRGPDVVILNYHKLVGWAEALRDYAKSVIFDEVQELRHADSQKYAAAGELAGRLHYRLGLSATPIYNYGGEIFNVLDALHPGALGTADEFFTEWCTGTDRKKAKIKDARAFGTYLREHFLMIRHTRKDVGRELPAVIRIPHRIGSDVEALDRIQDTAADLARIILEQGKTSKGAKFQAAEEFSVLLRQATGIAKAPYVADFVRLLVEAGESVVLCGWHREVYAIWMAKLADLHPKLYTGSETPAQKNWAKEAFIRGETKVLILSLRSGAGMNGLQEASSVIVFGELDYSPGVHEQCVGRLARDGQESPVAAYFLIAEDGSDPVIAEILGIKREQIEGIRNPEAELIEQLDAHGETRIRRLAERYLEQRGLTAQKGTHS